VIASTALTTVSLFANAQTTLELACPNGKRVLGGGFEASVNLVLHPIASFPPTPSSWRVVVRLSQDTAATFSWRVYAVCATVLN
jgi:hypothetical protein